MSLKDRLTRLTGDAAKSAAADIQKEKISELRRKIDRIINRRENGTPKDISNARRSAVPLEQIVSGEEVITSHGNFFLCRDVMSADDVHGFMRICDAEGISMEAAAFIAGSPITQNMSLSDALFIDTETTGLVGGTGTFPFLIGLGWFERGSFVVCQLFARDFSEEAAMLRHLSEVVSKKHFLVSFNGKAYDLNLLATRFILARCQNPLINMPHIDLLHPSRRIIAHRLENARLSTIEKHVLGVVRHGDVPGFEIPQRYFDWLRRRDGRLLGDVFMHNRLDIVSLVSLLKYLTGLVDDSHEMRHSHHGDLSKLAEMIHSRGDCEKARKMFEALILSHDTRVATCSQKSLSLIYKRDHRWKEAVQLWQNLVISDPCDYFAVEELAKYYEHHTREYRKAIELIGKFIDNTAWLSEDDRTSAEYRLRRLQHKVFSG